MTRRSAVEVAVPRPLPGAFTYGVPDALLAPGESTLPPGARVRVPFGPSRLTGVVLGPAPLPGTATETPTAADGGPTTGNATTGNATTGNAMGGGPTGGNATGGSPTTGNATTGNATTGNAMGGSPTGGNATGGNATGGSPTTGDSATGNPRPGTPGTANREAAGPKPRRLKPVAERFDDPLPPLPESLLELGRQLAEQTVCPLGIVLRAMLPAETAPGGRLVRTAAITPEGAARLGAPDPDPKRPLPRLRDDERRILTLLAVSDGAVPLVRIRRELGLPPGRRFARLAREGLLTLGAERLTAEASEPEPTRERSRPPQLTAAQRAAAETLRNAVVRRCFAPFLLDGVTGSGKTEVYFQAVAACLEEGRRVLLLVPEIALVARLEQLLRERFGPGLAVLHSGLAAAARRTAFWRIRRGDARIVLGARSAILAPVADLGLVILDEEHDGAYKQDDAPRYHARRAAWLRARSDRAVLVLGSATPSLEAAHAAASGAMTRLHLPSRTPGRELPEVEMVDMRPLLREHHREPARRGPLVLAPVLARALETTLAAGQQALVLLNRRGYGGRLACLCCGEIAECPRCRLALTLHRRGHLAVCHACGFGREPPAACPGCGGEVLRAEGFGTERVQEEVERLLPGVRVERFDRDTTRSRGAHARALDDFRRGEIGVLVGTQMIAKGHDFPAVTLVGVVAADGGLGVPDFRAAERTFQLLTQVAGRAGRGDIPGRVLIQTLNPDHYAVAAAARQDYPAFEAAEREMRRRFRYPPFVRLTSLIVTARRPAQAEAAATRVADAFRTPDTPETIEVIGPAPAPRPHAHELCRWQILLKTDARTHPALRRRLLGLLAVPGLARQLTVDGDP